MSREPRTVAVLHEMGRTMLFVVLMIGAYGLLYRGCYGHWPDVVTR